MEGIKNKLIIMTLTGTIMGFMIVVIIYMCGGYPVEMLMDRPAFLAQIIGSMLLGAVNMGGTVVYDVEKWGLPKVTFIHFSLSMCSFILANKLLGWFPKEIMLIVIAIFILVYMLIWLANYFSWKRQIKRMNKDLEILLRKDMEGADR